MEYEAVSVTRVTANAWALRSHETEKRAIGVTARR